MPSDKKSARKAQARREEMAKEMDHIAFNLLERLVDQAHPSPAKRAWEIAEEYIAEQQKRSDIQRAPGRVLELVKKGA